MPSGYHRPFSRITGTEYNLLLWVRSIRLRYRGRRRAATKADRLPLQRRRPSPVRPHRTLSASSPRSPLICCFLIHSSFACRFLVHPTLGCRSLVPFFFAHSPLVCHSPAPRRSSFCPSRERISIEDLSQPNAWRSGGVPSAYTRSKPQTATWASPSFTAAKRSRTMSGWM